MALAEIGKIVGASADDIKQELVGYFETTAKTCVAAIEAATNFGPHRYGVPTCATAIPPLTVCVARSVPVLIGIGTATCV